MIFGPATVEQVLQHGALTTGTSDLAGPDSLSAGRPWGFRVAEFVFRNMPSRVRFLDLEGARLGSAELAEMAASLRQLDLVELSLAGYFDGDQMNAAASYLLDQHRIAGRLAAIIRPLEKKRLS